jgi:hypothetical protein
MNSNRETGVPVGVHLLSQSWLSFLMGTKNRSQAGKG